MPVRQVEHHGGRSAPRRPIRGIAVALAIACAGGAGGLVLASYATGGSRAYAGAAFYGDSAPSDHAQAAHDIGGDVDLSESRPEDYSCRGCGPRLAARMAAQYGASYYDSAAYDYASPVVDDDAYRNGGEDRSQLSLRPHRPFPFDGDPEAPPATSAPVATALAMNAAPRVVRPVAIAAVSEGATPLPTDRMADGPVRSLLAPPAAQDQTARGETQQQQR